MVNAGVTAISKSRLTIPSAYFHCGKWRIKLAAVAGLMATRCLSAADGGFQRRHIARPNVRVMAQHR